MSSNEARIDTLHEGLDLKFKSEIRGRDSRCLVDFYNCTKYNVTLYWIDFNGNPDEYGTLRPRESIGMNTFVNHLWFFRASTEDNIILRTKKVLAIPEESLNSTCNASSLNYRQTNDLVLPERKNICALCRYIFKAYRRRPISSPCHHYSGETKLCSSDLHIKSDSDFNSHGACIYSCSDATHQAEHSQIRRSVYLVESFYNLREQCFIKLDGKLESLKFVDLSLPRSIIREYTQFIGAVRKLNSSLAL